MAKKKILFACVGNCCRSQMSEGIAKQIAGDKFDIYSAGSHPAGYVHPDAISGMKEIGIDISQHSSRGFDEIPEDFDYIVTMGCGETCPIVPAKHRLDWKIPDPIGRGIEYFREVRDDLKKRIEELLSSI